MSEQINEQTKPAIIVEFEDENSAVFAIRFVGGVKLSQMLLAGTSLEFEAKHLMNQNKLQREYMEAQREMAKQKIVVPNKGKVAVPELNFNVNDRDIPT